VSKLINLFGGPGIGKSGISAGITYELKKRHISCNNPYEFPKRLAWDNNIPAIKDQLYVFANQHRGIAESYGKVDYIVIDSPILFLQFTIPIILKDILQNFMEKSFIILLSVYTKGIIV